MKKLLWVILVGLSMSACAEDLQGNRLNNGGSPNSGGSGYNGSGISSDLMNVTVIHTSCRKGSCVYAECRDNSCRCEGDGKVCLNASLVTCSNDTITNIEDKSPDCGGNQSTNLNWANASHDLNGVTVSHSSCAKGSCVYAECRDNSCRCEGNGSVCLNASKVTCSDDTIVTIEDGSGECSL